jgi:hypothetical protein
LQQPLGEADVRFEQAMLALDASDSGEAERELTSALRLVEQVSQTIQAQETRSRFLQQYVELYAQTAIVRVQTGQEEQARSLLTSYRSAVGTAGSTALKSYIETYANSIPLEGEGMSRQEQLENANFVKILRKL